MSKRTYSVPEVHCDHCISAINRELGQIDGVGEIDVNLETKTVTVEAEDSVTDKQIADGLYEAGFDVESA
ncbi:MAG: heavy-metal-associated domain-containing protein [Thermomicrobiales bacterium]